MLTDPDAARYATAMANALRHLPIKAAQKAVDYAAFAMVAFSIETPRIVVSAQLAAQKKGQRPAPRGPAEIFQFTGGPAKAPGAPPGGPSAANGSAPPKAPEAAPPPFPQSAEGFGLAPEDGEGF